jgi:glycosyltransferase involved in cell wall biosynthesis/sulfatase maturation enzyme AslB (radical SAM superfamily)
MIKFSIVIPVYSKANKLNLLLSNIKTAIGDFDSYEIIIVDDGSINPLKISDNLFSSHFLEKITIIRQSNKGPGIARNLGVSAATGKYILFLDDGDCFSVGFLAILSEEIISKNYPEVVYFDFYYPNINDYLPRQDYYIFENLDTLKKATYNLEAYQECWSAAYSREFLLRNNLSFDEGYFEDILFALKTTSVLTNYSYLPTKLYSKKKDISSITSTISNKHLIDYIKVLEAVNKFLERQNSCSSLPGALKFNWSNAIISRVVWMCRLEIPAEERNDWISQYIRKLDKSELRDWRNFNKREGRILTQFNLAFRKFSRIDLDVKESLRFAMESIEEIINSSWSCKDLQNSVYLAPSEVRTCCKRFFRDGKLAGDVVLNTSRITVSDKANLYFVPLSEIHRSKRDLHRAINLGKQTDCDNCPFLEFKAWKSLNQSVEINYLSMEQHSVCNLRCIYCDEKYYGGELPNYDVMRSISDFSNNGALSGLSTVVWGGGEPTLDRNFEEMLDEILAIAPKCEHRFLTNGLRYSKTISKALSFGNSQVITSIDSGDEEKYLEIRGRKGFSKVLTNLRSYLLEDEGLITIKYIFTMGNKDSNSIDSFVNEIRKYQLQNCFFQISWDFKEEKIQKSDFLSVLRLFSGLYNINAKFIFLDDLLFLRLVGSDRSHVDWRMLLQDSGVSDAFLANENDFQNIVLFGAGKQAIQVQEKMDILSRWPVRNIVESEVVAGKNFFGRIVEPLTIIKESNAMIHILGVQSAPKMYKALAELGIEENRIIRKLLI